MSYIPITISTGSINTQASSSISLTSFYNKYTIVELILYGLTVSANNTTLTMRVSSNGTSFDTGSGNYMWAEGYSNTVNQAGAAGGTGSDASIQIANSLGNGSAIPSHIHVTGYNLSSTSSNPMFMIDAAVSNGTTSMARLTGAGQRLAAQVTEALQFTISSGTFSCSYVLRGFN